MKDIRGETPHKTLQADVARLIQALSISYRGSPSGYAKAVLAEYARLVGDADPSQRVGRRPHKP